MKMHAIHSEAGVSIFHVLACVFLFFMLAAPLSAREPDWWQARKVININPETKTPCTPPATMRR